MQEVMLCLRVQHHASQRLQCMRLLLSCWALSWAVMLQTALQIYGNSWYRCALQGWRVQMPHAAELGGQQRKDFGRSAEQA